MHRAETGAEADAGQTAVCPKDWLERGNTKHDNHIQFRDIFCLQEKLHVDDANDQNYSSTTSTITTAPTTVTIAKRRLFSIINDNTETCNSQHPMQSDALLGMNNNYHGSLSSRPRL